MNSASSSDDLFEFGAVGQRNKQSDTFIYVYGAINYEGGLLVEIGWRGSSTHIRFKPDNFRQAERRSTTQGIYFSNWDSVHPSLLQYLLCLKPNPPAISVTRQTFTGRPEVLRPSLPDIFYWLVDVPSGGPRRIRLCRHRYYRQELPFVVCGTNHARGKRAFAWEYHAWQTDESQKKPECQLLRWTKCLICFLQQLQISPINWMTGSTKNIFLTGTCMGAGTQGQHESVESFENPQKLDISAPNFSRKYPSYRWCTSGPNFSFRASVKSSPNCRLLPVPCCWH